MRKLALVLGVVLVSGMCSAEEARPDWRNMTAEQRTEYFATQSKKNLGVTDEEYKALQPKLDAVRKAQEASRGGFGGFGGRTRGGNGGTGGTPQDEATKGDVQKKTEALQKLIDNKDADAKEVTNALKDLREARAKGKEALKKAQDELKELLTAKQEAYLVLRGSLE